MVYKPTFTYLGGPILYFPGYLDHLGFMGKCHFKKATLRPHVWSHISVMCGDDISTSLQRHRCHPSSWSPCHKRPWKNERWRHFEQGLRYAPVYIWIYVYIYIYTVECGSKNTVGKIYPKFTCSSNPHMYVFIYIYTYNYIQLYTYMHIYIYYFISPRPKVNRCMAVTTWVTIRWDCNICNIYSKPTMTLLGGPNTVRTTPDLEPNVTFSSNAHAGPVLLPPEVRRQGQAGWGRLESCHYLLNVLATHLQDGDPKIA